MPFDRARGHAFGIAHALQKLLRQVECREKCLSPQIAHAKIEKTVGMGAIARYRHMFAKVMIAPFFIQLKGPVTPTFFQVVQAAVCGKLRPGRIPVPTR